ncbi:pseudouridine synthase [Spiroplasma sp. DGKH1]|uniref:pseudouridine synthase n=1 Tax=Spiroplasma sp. DGKH1 TaxID=3050074 RepID=UPI0034C63749
MERLQKVIANYGYASRRKAEELIAQHRVKVNGEVIREMGFKVSPHDVIMIDNKILANKNQQKIYIMLNKPRNTVSTVRDPHHRKTVLSYLPGISQRVYPVGRLDYDTSGLLLITNDGEFANIITHPKHIIDKTYHVLVKGVVTKTQLRDLARGVTIADNFTTSPAQARVLKYSEKDDTTVVELIIHEGKKHQVKRMLTTVGSEVLKLKRVAIGFLQLDESLKPGEWRYLKPKEIKRFFGIFNSIKK